MRISPATVRRLIMVLILLLWELVPRTGLLAELFLPSLAAWFTSVIGFAAVMISPVPLSHSGSALTVRPGPPAGLCTCSAAPLCTRVPMLPWATTARVGATSGISRRSTSMPRSRSGPSTTIASGRRVTPQSIS